MNATTSATASAGGAGPADDGGRPWRVLVVDDDPGIHAATRMSIRELMFEGRPLEILSAYSAGEARDVLAANPDIAMVLLDVVLETDHAGLDLARWVREELGNRAVRLVLQSGQPGTDGTRTILDVIQRYEIDDYRSKTGMSFEALTGLTMVALRNHRLLCELELAIRAKDQFLAHMSHELRTPLNAVIGFTELLLDGQTGPVNPLQREYLDDILGSSRHLLQLIDHVLDLSTVGTDRIELYPETFPVAAAVEEVFAVVRVIAGEKRVEIHASLAAGPSEVTLDPWKFKQVLHHLLSNAVKFSHEGGRVDLSIQPVGDRFRLQVRDRGIGIRGEDLPRLFRDFEQLDSGTTRRYGGSGLGLVLTRKVVERQGGTIGVESEPGAGSTFTVELPQKFGAPP